MRSTYQNTCDNVGFVLELVVKSDSLVLWREQSQAEVVTPFGNFHHFAIGRHLYDVEGEILPVTLIVKRNIPSQTDDVRLEEKCRVVELSSRIHS